MCGNDSNRPYLVRKKNWIKNINCSWRKLIFKKKSELFLKTFSGKKFKISKFSFFKLIFRRNTFSKIFDLDFFFEIFFFSRKMFSSESQFEKWKFQNFEKFSRIFFKKSSDVFFENQFSSWKINIFHPKFFSAQGMDGYYRFRTSRRLYCQNAT